jgi:antitoxin (DNA-binding transcriptional repressor) of toxin-antitoxin stability system
MKRLSIREVRAALKNLEELLEKEGEVLILRRGRAIARLLPVHSAKAMPSHAALRASMRPLKTGSERAIRADRQER